MSQQPVIGSLLGTLINIYLLILVVRLVMDYVLMFNRSYRPTGGMAIFFDWIFAITDPPLKALRRVIPPLRIGTVSIDLGFLILFIGLQVVKSLVSKL